MAEENGYYCIHIFDWMDKQEVIDKIKQGLVPVTRGRIRRHWVRKNEHIVSTGKENYGLMLKDGYLPVFDAGII